MYPQGGEKLKTKYITQDRTNLTLLVLILGILSLISIGIMALGVLRQFYPPVAATINKQLNYQGKLQDASGITVPDGDYEMKFSIYDDPTSNDPIHRLWTECGTTSSPTARTVSVYNGVFSVMLGDTDSNACPGGADSNEINLDFNSANYWLGVTVESDPEMTPRKRIGAAGYAFNADLLDGLDTSYIGGSNAFVPVTDSSGNFVLTRNVNFDSNTFYLDATNNVISINGIPPFPALQSLYLTSDKVNGAIFKTSSFIGKAVYGEATGDQGIGIYGKASGTVDTNVGGYFTAAGIYGLGVYAEATGIGGRGVQGIASDNSSNANYGGYFLASGTGLGTAGVLGQASGAANEVYGVYGEATSNANVTNYGGYFYTEGQTGRGVYGAANYSGAATNYGGYFTAAGTGSGTAGVYAEAAGPANYVLGVYGKASNSGAYQNIGGYFEAAGSGAGATGVFGKATGAGTVRGVRGEASATGSVTNYGGYFTAAGKTGYGIYAEASATDGNNYGVYGKTMSNLGWAGYFTGGYGVYSNKSLVAGTAAIGLADNKKIIIGEELYSGGPLNTEPNYYYGIYNKVTGEVDPGTCDGGKPHTCYLIYYNQFNSLSTNGSYELQSVDGFYQEVTLGGSDTTMNLKGAVIIVSQNSTTGYTNATGIYVTVGEGGFGGEISTGYGGNFNSVGGEINFGVHASAAGDSTTSMYSYGLYGFATGGTLANYGVYGYSNSWSGKNYGIYGAAEGAGYGVYGIGNDWSAVNYGVYGTTNSSNGWAGYFTGGKGLYADIAVIGDPTAPVGGYVLGMLNAEQLCIDGDCVSSWASATPPGGLNTYVQFNDSGSFGGDSGFTYDKINDYLYVAGRVGIGAAPNYPLHVSTNSSLAVFAQSSADWGFAFYGTTSGANSYAVRGNNQSTGYGGYFDVVGANSTGVYSIATSASGTNYGVQGYATSGYGGYFTGSFAGVVGNSTNGNGVAGYSTDASGVFGQSINSMGGQFLGGSIGVHGVSGSIGVYGVGIGAGGSYGIYGLASELTGTNYGVYGQVISSSSWAGYFTGGYGIYGDKLVAGSAVNPGTYELYITGEGYLTSNFIVGAANTLYVDVGNNRVGIGTATPTSKLHVYGPGSASGLAIIQSSIDTETSITFDAPVRDWRIGQNNVDIGYDKFFIYDQSASAARLVIDTSGNVGIGIVNPSNRLHVAGNALITDNLVVDTNTLYVDAAVDGVGIGKVPSYPLDITTSTALYALNVESSAANNYAIRAWASGSSSYAIYGYNSGSGVTYGVYGYATSSNGVGIYGLASGTAGVAVQGAATGAGAVTNYGGLFTAAGTTGYGVKATASATSGANYGGYFESASSTGYGVYGLSSSTAAGTGYGGYFSTGTTLGRGVYGEASNTAVNTNYGGYFLAKGGLGRGVYGEANNASGTTYGGYFISAGSTGSYGVYARATNTGAVQNYGGYFEAAGTSGAFGVYGNASGTSGTTYGVRGQVTSTTGYSGYFSGGVGVYIGTALGIDDTTPTEATLVVGNAGAGNIYATFATSGTERLCWDASGASLINDCTGSPGDYAEYYGTTDPTIEPGDLVILDPANPAQKIVDEQGIPGTKAWVIKSSQSYQEDVIGVVSTYPNEVIGENFAPAENPRAVAMIGRLPIKVNVENGVINAGDPITTSSTPGVGMKATKPGAIIGKALESWSGPGQGIIVIFFNPGWHAGGTITTDGMVAFFDDNFTFNKTGTADAVTEGYDSKVLTLLGSGWDGVAAQNVGMSLKNTVTNAANYKLSILNSAGVEVASIGQDGELNVSGKFYPASPTGMQNSRYIFYRGNYMRTNASGWSTGSYDFAEVFLSREFLEPGDVVSVDGETKEYVKKSTGAYDAMIVGIISTEPGFLAGTNVDFDNPSPDQGYPVALAGRVPTKVSIENGPIAPGDPLTASSQPGVAMKATKPGMIIGVALEGWNRPEVGKIKVFVNLSWYGMNGSVTPVSKLAQLNLAGNLNMNGNYILNVGRIIAKNEKWMIDENGIFKVKLVSEDHTEKEMFGFTSTKVEMSISGSDRLENGEKLIDLTLIDENFVKNISTETPLKIFITPAEEMNGVYIAERDSYSFRVKELNGGTSNAAFDWLVVARRKGYEDPPSEEPTSTPEPVPPVSSPSPEPPPAEPQPSESGESSPSESAPSEPISSEPVPSESAPGEPAPSEPAPVNTEAP